MTRSAVTMILALGLSIGAVGCAPASTRSPAPTTAPPEEPSPTPTPTPTPTEQAEPEVDRIVLTADAIVVLGSDGSELAAFDYFQDTSELVAGFTELFGRPPTDIPFEGDAHSPAGIERSWDGFSILDDEREPAPPHTPNHLVDVTALDADGITVETADGFSVGTPAEDVLAAPDADVTTAEGMQIIQIDAVPLDYDDPICPQDGCTLSVRLFADEGGGAITRMLAPAPNFGP